MANARWQFVAGRKRRSCPGFSSVWGGSRVATKICEKARREKLQEKSLVYNTFKFVGSLSLSGRVLATLFLVRRRGGSKRAPVRIAPGAKMLWWWRRSPPPPPHQGGKKILGVEFLPPTTHPKIVFLWGGV